MPGYPIHLLWMADIVAECATAAVIYRRRAHTSFPLFFSLLLFMCAKSVTLITLSVLCLPTAYFYVYWVGAAVRTVLLGGVIGELSQVVLRRSRWLPDHISQHCVVLSGGILLVAAFFARAGDANGLCSLARQANEIVSWTFLVALSAMLVLSGLLEVSWTRRAAGITVGLLVEVWMGSLSAVVGDLFGRAGIDNSNWVRLSAFLITNCIWIASFLLPETETPLQLDSSHCTQNSQV